MSDTNEQAEVPAGGEIVDLEQVEANELEDQAENQPNSEGEGGEPEPKSEDEGDKPDEEGQPRKRTGIQRLKSRNADLAGQLAERDRVIQDLQSRLTANPEDKEPNEADFNGDYLAYERAKTSYDVRQTIREERRSDQLAQLETQKTLRLQERVAAHEERVEAAREFIKDYDDLVSKAPAVSRAVGEEILASDKSELIAYHLASNPEKIHALNRMSERELAREIGRLEATVRSPTSKRQTGAPPPATSLRGGAAAAFDPSKSSMDDYIAKRNSGWRG